MRTHGAREYRREMAAVHDEVVRTGESVIVTKDGKPYVKIVPADQESVLQSLREEGVVLMPSRRRPAVEAIDAGGDDTTAVIASGRR